MWKRIAGLPDDRIVKMGDKDNFWAMGDTGPCGPCSEIHFDQGPEFGPEGDFETDRYLEIWNLVFMQFEQKADGGREPLPKPSIDTGMGLERLCAVVGGHSSNYDTDLFTPLLDHVAKLTGVDYDRGEKGVSHRVLADHVKAAVFLVGDGILPSNEGRGYVLRRIMRRAIRHGYLLGSRDPILPKLAETVKSIYAEAFPALSEKWEKILSIISREEESFLKTIDKGIGLFDSSVETWKAGGEVPGEAAFKLYDTYGFPLDLTEVMAEGEGLKVDQSGFDACMAEQRRKAQAASMFKTGQLQGLRWNVVKEGEQSFVGYEGTEVASGLLRHATTESGQILLVPETSAFYGESGGQVGDRGQVDIAGNTVEVVDAQIVEGLRTLVLDAGYGEAPQGDEEIYQRVDEDRRLATQANHTSTHLLHKVLKEVIGEHAEQRGSWVGPTHLRFDFPHHQAVSREELAEVESRVNELIQADLPVETRTSSLEQAKADGVTALFGEKYDNDVRVVDIGGSSMELCGGTHLTKSSQAMAFVIRSESSVASGIRRIEAVTGPAALQALFTSHAQLKEAGLQIQAQGHELAERIGQIQKESQNLRKEAARLKSQLVMADLQEKLKTLPSIKGVPYLAEILEGAEAGDLRTASDAIRQIHKDLPMLLASRGSGRANVLIAFPKAWVKEKKVNAGQVLKPLGRFIKGGGGGSPELAQAGGKDPEGLPEVLKGFKEALETLA